MARTSIKKYSKEFREYQEFIIDHENYRGLPIEYKKDGTPKWVAAKDTVIGVARLDWADNKITVMKITGEGKYAKLMYAIHPTKIKVCQTCGKSMSINYIYLNKNLVDDLNKKYNTDFDICTTIENAYDTIVANYDETQFKKYLCNKFKLNLSPDSSKEEILCACEYTCRIEGKSNLLGPGAMSNFPDRFDGFHSYNRCCRGTEDKGRSKENLDSYNKDRRAYEYWSDGNICSANGFMRSPFFKGNSADHIGPISLGFVHDSRNIQPMSSNENSSKRNKLSYEIIIQLIGIESTGTKIISWYSEEIWDFIKNHLINDNELIQQYRLSLKKNISNYMRLLKLIKDSGDMGITFLEETFLKPKMEDFKYTYEWDFHGNIVNKKPRRQNDANKKEYDRLKRVCLESLDYYEYKDNRNNKPDLTQDELLELQKVIDAINIHDFHHASLILKKLVKRIQTRLNKDNEKCFKIAWSEQPSS